MSEDDIAEHDPLQCTCFDCLRGAGYGWYTQGKARRATDCLRGAGYGLQQEDETQQRESAGGDDE